MDEDGRKLEDFNPSFAGSTVDGVKLAIPPDTPFSESCVLRGCQLPDCLQTLSLVNSVL